MPTTHGPITWMVKNKVAANLLMLIFLIGGFLFAVQIKKEVFPDFTLDMVTVSVAYPGATPAEVEQGIVLAVEDEIRDIEGIKELTATVTEGSAQIVAELEAGEDRQQVYNEIKQAVDSIVTFPEEAEKPNIALSQRRRDVITLMLYGDTDEWTLRDYAESLRDRLLADPGINQVELERVRSYEIKIMLSNEALERYGLTLPNVAQIVSDQAVELSGGTIKAEGGELLLRMNERKNYAPEFERIALMTSENGQVVRLGEVARIHDGFSDEDVMTTFNGKNAVSFEVYRTGMQTPIGVSDAVKNVLKQFAPELPAGLKAEVLRDRSDIYRQRLHLLLKNAAIGLALVLLILGAFLEFRLAFWVAVGIPTAFMGAFLFLPIWGVSINMVSMFAFIIALGIVVDDAIIAGENIYEYRLRGMDYTEAAIKGARDILQPLSFAIITNIAAFSPLLFVPGMLGKLFVVIPAVVVTVFLLSWVEAVFILPHHLASSKESHEGKISGFLYRNQQRVAGLLDLWIERVYLPSLEIMLHYRYATVATAFAVLMIVMAYAMSGRMGFTMMPTVESDRAIVRAKLPVGATMGEAKAVEKLLIGAGLRAVEKVPGDLLVGYRGLVEENTVRIDFFLEDAEVRPISTAAFNRIWRKEIGPVAGVDSIRMISDIGGPSRGQASLTIELSHRDTELLEEASAALAEEMRKIADVKDVEDGFTPGKREYTFTLLPYAHVLGLSTSDIARQVRAAFYGAQALRQQRGRNEVRVLVQLPENERVNVQDLYALKIRTAEGAMVPLPLVATLHEGRAYSTITRRDGRRTVSVEANVEPERNLPQVLGTLEAQVFPQMQERFRDLMFTYRGKQQDTQEGMSALMQSFILVLMVIYLMLALPFQSYTQPILVMVAIPFGVIGAFLGHMLMGYSLSIISIMGIVALAGVVINDSLVLIDYANRQSREGYAPHEAITLAAKRRFRPIVLTTATTFGGLAPMIYETSIQARFLIPMAISLGYGILFATLITLVLIPSLYLIQDDVSRVLGKVRGGEVKR